MVLKFGPAGIGPVKDAITNLIHYKNKGLCACEIAFTYGIYIKSDKDMENIRKNAEDLGIRLSIHAPYFVNLNSNDTKKAEDSKLRIFECCKVGEKLGAKTVVFHPGYYMGNSESETLKNIKNAILSIKKMIRDNGFKINIAPETMGKVNVFGSIEHIAELVKATDCSFCIDFAHILAREKKIDYEKIISLFKQKEWHVHFSGILYSEKGEKKHLKTTKEAWKELIINLPKDKDITIINESPDMVNDSIVGQQIYEKLIRV